MHEHKCVVNIILIKVMVAIDRRILFYNFG